MIKYLHTVASVGFLFTLQLILWDVRETLGVHKPHFVSLCFRFGYPRGSVRVAKSPSGKEET